jgi:hypothetical protein
MKNKNKWLKLAIFYKENQSEKAAIIYEHIKDHKKASEFYEKTAHKYRLIDDYKNARKCYLKAVINLTEYNIKDIHIEQLYTQVSACEEYMARVSLSESTESIATTIDSSVRNMVESFIKSQKEISILKADALLKGFSGLSTSIRDSFQQLSNSLFEGFNSLSNAQKAGALKIAESIMNGFDKLSESQLKSAFMKASATLMGMKELSGSTKMLAENVYQGFSLNAQAKKETFKELSSVMLTGFKEIAGAGEKMAHSLDSVADMQQKAAQMIQWSIWGRRASRGLLAGVGHYLSNDFFRPGIAGAIEQISEK